MLNGTIILKVKQRLNKIDSQDYDNLEVWQIIEAFNKGQVDWCRRNLHGSNTLKEGDEQSTSRIDDLEVLLITRDLASTKHGIYYESDSIPADYLRWKRISCNAKNDCCPGKRRMKVYLAEEANIDILLEDCNKKPSYDWGETFATLKNRKLYIYTDGDFEIEDLKLTHYRQPRKIEIAGVPDPYSLVTPTVDVLSELKDDLIELIIDETVKILSGDIESFNQTTRSTQSVETNN